MENLVISVFNTESEAYQSFTEFKGFQTDGRYKGRSNCVGEK